MKPTTTFTLIKKNVYSDINYLKAIEANLIELQKRIEGFEKVKVSKFTFEVLDNTITITKEFIKGYSFEKLSFSQRIQLAADLYQEHVLNTNFGIIDFSNDNFIYDNINDEYYYIDHEGVGFKTERSLESYEKYFGNYLRKHRNQI
jgi:hypothetical protein